jgi:hypothetical protein
VIASNFDYLGFQEADIYKFQQGRVMPGAGRYRRKLDLDFKVEFISKKWKTLIVHKISGA